MKTVLAISVLASLVSLGCQRPQLEQAGQQQQVEQNSTREITPINSSAQTKSNVVEIRLAGNRSVSYENFMANLRTKPGEVFSEATIVGDIERLLALGLFDDVRVRDEGTADGGHILTFQIKEKLPG